jgi:iron complex outermembrane receptor protein
MRRGQTQRTTRRDACVVATAGLLLIAASVRAETGAIVPPRLQDGQDLSVAYPAGAPTLAASARIVLQLLIDRDGRVDSARPVEVEIEPRDADAAPFIANVEARARALRFEPARRGEQPIDAFIRFAFRIRPELAGEQSFEPPAGTAASAGDAEPPPTGSTEGASIGSSEPPPAETPVATPPASVPASPPPPSAAPAPDADFGAHANATAGAGKSRASAASDIDIEVGALRSVPRRAAQDYLTLAPGLVLANHAGIGHAAGVFMRGFDAGEGQDLEVTVDGVPINEPSNAHGHGYADTQFVIPEVIDRVRVLEGPFDPRQGDFAVAGSAGYELGVAERGIRAQVGYGSFDERRALLLWAPTDAARGTFAAVDFREGDGFGPNRAHSSLSALARYAGGSGPLSYSVLLGSHALDFDSAGVVREDAYRARQLPCAKDEESQFFCVADPAQGGSAARHLFNGKLEWRRPDRSYQLQGYGMLRNLRLRENFTGALLDPRGDGLDEGYEAATVGVRAAYALTPHLWNARQRIEVGLDARHDTGNTRSWRLRRETVIAYATVFDRDLALTHVGVYLRGELNYTRYLTLLGGARLDGFAYHTENQAAPSSDRVGPRLPKDARDAFGSAFSPRGSLVAHILPELDWTVSGGLGVRSSDAEALSEGEDAPFARVISLETGPTARSKIAGGELEARTFAFATRVEDDLLFDARRGRNVMIGPSNRYGASASARARFGTSHDTLLSVTWTEAHQTARDASIFELDGGPRLPFVPRWVARLDHASNARLTLGSEVLQLGAAAGVSWVGPQPLPLATESQARFQVDASVRARLRFLELGLSVENLFDRRNPAAELNYASFFGEDGDAVSMRSVRHFAAGAPRLWMLTLTAYVDDVASSDAGDKS